MPTSNAQREFAEQVVKKLRDTGHEALWAGGCVRDQLLGRTPKDYDVATSARPDQVRELFGHRRTLAIGAAFGVISILGGKKRDAIEVATFRSDGAYLDGRHPTEVTFTTAEEDAQRRDFTINGLFYDPLSEKLIDYVNGEQDLLQGVVRAIGEPSARFAEDKLRMLRAVRFATTFDFVVDQATLTAIRNMAAEVHAVSAERIGAEVRKVLQHPQRRRGVELLRETNLLLPLFPALADWTTQNERGWQSLLGTLDNLETESVSVALAILFSQTGFGQTDRSDRVREYGRRFRFTNKEIDRAAWLVEKIGLIDEAANLPWPRLQPLLVHEGTDDLLALAVAMRGDEHEGVRVCRERLALPAEQLDPKPLITGDDLVGHGLRPRKYFGELLDHIRTAQLEQLISDRQQALRLADEWLRHHPRE